MTDVVVIGRRIRDDQGGYQVSTHTSGGGGGGGGGNDLSGTHLVYEQELSPDQPPSEPEIEIGIKVHCTSTETCSKAVEAARELLVAVMIVLTECEKHDRGDTVTVAGITITVGEIYDTIYGTTYTVTDQTVFSNHGGGAADRASMTDLISYVTIGAPAINGDSGVAPATGYQAYVDGLLGLVLHEAAHMSPEGDAFYNRSVQIARDDPTVSGQLYVDMSQNTQDYALNNEAFANEVARSIAGQLDIDLAGFNPGFAAGTTQTVVSPDAIFTAHTGLSYDG